MSSQALRARKPDGFHSGAIAPSAGVDEWSLAGDGELLSRPGWLMYVSQCELGEVICFSMFRNSLEGEACVTFAQCR